ncbi:MAG: hypothetical protein KAI75_05790 [Desulfobulbaceae bacterium]|nr:hypothetical protein [Desulfobulbaceae bacterium]
MSIVSLATVEETWQEVAGFSTVKAHHEMQELNRKQGDFLAYFVELTKTFDKDVSSFAIFLFFSVYRMFERHANKDIPKVSADEVMKFHERNEDFIANLSGVHDRLLDRIANAQIEGQPHVMKYVVDSLFEAPEKAEVLLSPEETGYLYLLLKTAVDLLSDITSRQSKKITKLSEFRK